MQRFWLQAWTPWAGSSAVAVLTTRRRPEEGGVEVQEGGRPMAALSAVAGMSLILLMLFEAFETLLLPRRVTRPFRLTRWFYVYSWRPGPRRPG